GPSAESRNVAITCRSASLSPALGHVEPRTETMPATAAARMMRRSRTRIVASEPQVEGDAVGRGGACDRDLELPPATHVEAHAVDDVRAGAGGSGHARLGR